MASPRFQIREILAFVLAFALALGALAAPVHAAPATSCARAYLQLTQVTQDAAVELEMEMSFALMKLLTTPDGTVGPVLQGLSPPDFLVKLAGPSFPDPAKFPWRALTHQQKLDLLNYQGKHRPMGFFENRRVFGLKVKDEIELQFSQPTEFLGKTYPAGTHRVNVAQHLGKVEYMGADDIEDLRGLELHFRSGQGAGRASRDARTLQKGIFADETHQHVHIVARLPLTQLAADPTTQAAAMGDYYRRVNLFAEIAGMLDGYFPKRIAKDGVEFFDGLGRQNLQGVTDYFFQVAQGKFPAIRDDYKMAWVGMRGADVYDRPGLWGLEYRIVNAEGDEAAVQHTLDAIQWAMETNNYGLKPGTMERWADYFLPNGGNPAAAVANAWYHNNLQPRNLWPHVPEMITRGTTPRSRRAVEDALAKKRVVQMLLFDWSRDSLFFDDTKALKKILLHQARAIDQLGNGARVEDVMREFLWKSGIAERVADSVHMQLELKKGVPTAVRGAPYTR